MGNTAIADALPTCVEGGSGPTSDPVLGAAGEQVFSALADCEFQAGAGFAGGVALSHSGNERLRESGVLTRDRGVRGAGEPGELLVRSEFMTAGRWNSPDATAEILKPCPHLASLIGAAKVLHTGDVVRRDEDGYLWFVGRKDAQFKVADYRVNPDEIEQALTSSGLVAHAVAFGARDAKRGTVVHAAIFARDDAPVDETAIRKHCRRVLPAHLVPVKLHVWKDEMPIVGPGKPDRARIIETLGR